MDDCYSFMKNSDTLQERTDGYIQGRFTYRRYKTSLLHLILLKPVCLKVWMPANAPFK